MSKCQCMTLLLLIKYSAAKEICVKDSSEEADA